MQDSKRNKATNLSIDSAEKTLDIKYPKLIREKLKQENGFNWGEFEFYPILEKNKQITSNDVVKENNDPTDGWNQDIPAEYVCIASSDLECILLNKNKDGKLYYWITGHDVIEMIFENADKLAKMLNEQELSAKLDLPAKNKYFIKLMLYSIIDDKRLLLMFYNKPNLEDPSKGKIYCSKVGVGKRLSEVIGKEVKHISGQDEYILNKIYNDGFDLDKHGKEVIRYGLDIQVSHFKTENKRFSELKSSYMSWVDVGKLNIKENQLIFIDR